MADLAALTADDFEPLVGTAFRLVGDSAAPEGPEGSGGELVLTGVRRRGRRWDDREAFALSFEGTGPDCLPQQVHELRHDTLGDLAIFLVPVARTDTGFGYDAVFS